MELDTYQPTFLIEIEGQALARDITQEITAFSFTDNEEEMDELELCVTNRDLQFVDDPLFQEGNEVVVRFGYAGDLGPRKKAVIKEVQYDFPEGGEPTIRMKAFDKGCRLAGRENQKVWQAPEPGILYSEIAAQIAVANNLTPKVTPTLGRHLRVVQSNMSDAQFLKELATKARASTGAGGAGYVFYVQDDELHFHPRALDEAPVVSLEYFTDRRGVLRSFRPTVQAQGARGAGVETKAVGVDPRKKEATEHRANNVTTPTRATLGKRTYLVDGNSGEGKFQGEETGHVVPSFEPQEAAHDAAEAKFKEAELRQVEAVAVTIGIPLLRAKRNIEIVGVGTKFSGIYYCHSVRHTIDGSGYSCELKLKRNALGRGAGEKAEASGGQVNDQAGPNEPRDEKPGMVRIDAETGALEKVS